MSATDDARALADAGKRLSEAVTLAQLADPIGNIGRWLAAQLSDGRVRAETLPYPTKADAVASVWPFDRLYAYVCIPAGRMPPEEAAAFLAAVRRLYDAGRNPAEHDVSPNLRRINLG